jgi:hypothetical protein
VRTDIRNWAALVLATLLSAASPPSRAADVGNLYEVSVPGSGLADAEVFSRAMASVLVRVTGLRDAASLPELAGLIDGASRYVSSYRRVSAGRLAVRFDAESIERAVAAAGLPFWAEDRPTTLVWLAVDHGGGQRGLVASGGSREREAVEQAAEERGVPLVWPAPVGSAEARRRFDQAWSGDPAALAAEAPEYGASAVLVGRASSGGDRDGYAVEWTFFGPGGSERARGGLEEGVHLAADRLAARYASAEAGRRDELDVVITGVGSAARYAEATRYLESLPVVRGVGVREVRPDAVVFRVAVRGGFDSLRRAAIAGERMIPVESATGEAAFRLQP